MSQKAKKDKCWFSTCRNWKCFLGSWFTACCSQPTA